MFVLTENIFPITHTCISVLIYPCLVLKTCWFLQMSSFLLCWQRLWSLT